MEEKNRDSVAGQNHYYRQSEIVLPTSSDKPNDTHFAEYPKTPKTLNGLIVFIVFPLKLL